MQIILHDVVMMEGPLEIGKHESTVMAKGRDAQQNGVTCLTLHASKLFVN